MKLQLWDDALVQLNRSIKAGGYVPFAYKWRAEVNEHLGNYNAAVDDMSSLLVCWECVSYKPILPERAEILLKRARLEEKLCKFDFAFRDLVAAQIEICLRLQDLLCYSRQRLYFLQEHIASSGVTESKDCYE